MKLSWGRGAMVKPLINTWLAVILPPVDDLLRRDADSESIVLQRENNEE